MKESASSTLRLDDLHEGVCLIYASLLLTFVLRGLIIITTHYIVCLGSLVLHACHLSCLCIIIIDVALHLDKRVGLISAATFITIACGGFIIILIHCLVSLVLHARHLSCLCIVIIDVALRLDALHEGVCLIFAALLLTFLLRGLIIILTHYLISLVLHACHLSCLCIIIIDVALHLDERICLISAALVIAITPRRFIIVLTHYLVSLVFHACHLSCLCIVIIDAAPDLKKRL